MRYQRESGRWRRAAVVFATTAALIAASSTSASAVGRQNGFVDGGFSDGLWVGVINYRADITLEDSSATGGLDEAMFVVTWTGGAPDGILTGFGSSSVSFDDGASGSIEVSVEADIVGTSTAPEFAITSFISTGSITADGFEIPIDLSFGPGELPNTPFDVTFSTCGNVSGNLDTAAEMAAENVAAAGGSFAARQAVWSAVKVENMGDEAENQARMDNLGLIMLEGHNFAAEIEAGNFPGPGFGDLLQRAQQFGASASWNGDCGQPSGEYGTVLTEVMDRILDAMAANPLTFTADEWHQAVQTGIASGTLGPGSGPDGAQLRNELLAALELVEPTAVLPGELFDLHQAYVALGDDESAARTLALMEGEGE